MPRLSLWSVRASLVYLAMGFTIGALLLFNKGVPLYVGLWALLPAHVEFLLVGWTAQLAMGVAFWILPRFTQEPKRGNVAAAWVAILLLNTGVLLVGASVVLPSFKQVNVLGRTAELAAAFAFALHAWPRIRQYKRTTGHS